MSRPLRALLLVALALGASTLAVAQPNEARTGLCPDGADVRGIGRLCPRGDGLFDVFTPDGRYVGPSHGPDPAPSGPETTSLAGSAPACVDGAPGQYYAQVIYARAYDDANGYASWAPRIRAMVEGANQLVSDAATMTGGRADLKVRCVDGANDVLQLVLPTARASASFGTIVGDLQDLGYADGRVKYWIFYDDASACTCGGMGHIMYDSQPGPANANNGNVGPMYAITFGYDSVRIMLHELGHNLGAVQLDAPNTSGGWHCIDGADTMCYDDGGWNAQNYRSTYCSAEVFDCGKDDYFHANPAPGSYLDTHWNLGDQSNRYFRFGNPAFVGVLCDDAAEVGAPAACQMRAIDDSAGIRYTVDWGDGTVETVPAEGYLPPDVIRTATHAYASPGERTVSIRVVDDQGLTAGPLSETIQVHPDLTPPTLVVADPQPGRVYRGCGETTDAPIDRVVWIERGCFRADATDTGSGVARVELLIDGEVFVVDEEAPYEAEVDLPAGYWLNTALTARAVDGAGNVATFTVRGYLLGS